jgi:hypothetical protein
MAAGPALARRRLAHRDCLRHLRVVGGYRRAISLGLPLEHQTLLCGPAPRCRGQARTAFDLLLGRETPSGITWASRWPAGGAVARGFITFYAR